MTARLIVVSILLAMLIVVLLALCPSLPASAQAETATPTLTYTPIPTRTPTPVISTTTLLPDGTGVVFTNTWTAEGRAVFDAVLALAALYGLRFLYDVAKQWNR